MGRTVEAGIIGLCIGLAAWWWLQRNQQDYAIADDSFPQDFTDDQGFSMPEAAAETWTELENTIYESTGLDMGGGDFIQALNTRGAPYRELLEQAEAAYGIPPLMLCRLAYQESRFRQDIISGQKISSAGAVGIMQIVPRWHPDVNPLDVGASIRYAAKYLASLYRQFGTWERALQAYNWGPGNLNKYLKGQIGGMPTETANYSRQILADIGSNYA